MKVETYFLPNIDRYYFDFNECSYANGWCQIDTGQDAWYFGAWVHPDDLKITSYTEGDIYETTFDDISEMINELQEMKDHSLKTGFSFWGIDPGSTPEMRKKLKRLGLKKFLHGWTEK